MRSPHILPALLVMSLIAAACGGAEQVDLAAPSTEQPSIKSTTTTNSVAAPTTTTTTTSSTTISSTTISATTTTSPGATTSAATADLVPLVGSGQIDLNSIQGQDTVLWFWAPW